MAPDYLNDTEKSAIAAFNSNPYMVDAVRKVLLSNIYHQGTVLEGKQPSAMNFAFALIGDGTKTNEHIGAELRASIMALGYLKSGFDRLTEIKVEQKTKKDKPNPAL